jgi:mannosyltransferase
VSERERAHLARGSSPASRLLVVVLLLLAGFGLRMARLQERDLWYDEAFAILYSSLTPGRILSGTVTAVEGAGAADVHPLLYYFLLHGWVGLAGTSPMAARFLSVALGTVTVSVLWRMADWAFDRRVGVSVALLAIVNPFHLAYSQEARMYALLALATAVASWGLLRALAGAGRARWWALYSVGGALTLYAHNLGIFHLLALHLLVLSRREWRSHLRSVLLSDLFTVAAFLPWLLAVLPGQLGFVQRGYWLAPPGMDELVRAAMLPVLSFYEPGPSWMTPLALFTGLLAAALLVVQSVRIRSRARWFLLLAWGPIAMLFLASLYSPVYLERALLPSALFYLLSLGWLLIRGRLPKAVRLALAGLMVLCTAIALAAHYTYSAFPRPPFAESAGYLKREVEQGDVIVHTNKLTYFPMEVYAPGLPTVFLADPEGSPQDTLALPTQQALGIFGTSSITEAVGAADRVWLVYFEREMQEAEQGGGEHQVLSWIEDRFRETDRISFSDLSVTLLSREGS